MSAGHEPLGFAHPTVADAFESDVRQVVGAVVANLPGFQVEADGGRGGFDSPVDSHGLACFREWFRFDVHDEGRVPVSVVPVDPYRFRWGWQRAGPDDGDGDAFGEFEPRSIVLLDEPESADAVVERRLSGLAALVSGHSGFAGGGDGFVQPVEERFLAGFAVVPHGLLLGYAGVLGEPSDAVPVDGGGSKCGEVFLRLLVAEFLVSSVPVFGFVHHAVPHVAACVPFVQQVLFGLLAGAESVRVSNLHDYSIPQYFHICI